MTTIVREALLSVGYTVDGVIELLGPAAFAALGRGETVPALRATTGGSPLETLTRMFVLQAPVGRAAAARSLPDLEAAAAAGLVVVDGDTVHALVDVRPYAADEDDFFVVSDLGTGIGGVSGPVREDHVLGVGGASTTLAQITVRPNVGRALDLGTGCGVQALHLAAQNGAEVPPVVVATDTNPRALELAALTAQLSGVRLDLRRGSLFEPVAHERFDLVVSNPPFVVSPGARFMYRDGDRPGDDLCRDLVTQAPEHLAPGGWCQLLANWLHVRGEDWRERVAGWVAPTGTDAWVVQREAQDPSEYVELWLRDSGDHGTPAYPGLYDAWLRWFEVSGVEAVGFGWITLHAGGSDDPFVRIEDLRQAVAQPVGHAVEQWFGRHDLLRGLSDDDLLALPLAMAADVHLEQESVPGDPAFPLASLRLRQSSGLRRTAAIDPTGVSVLGRCDGRAPLREALVAALGGDVSEDGVRGALGAVRGLLEDGYLVAAP
jgi:methylase of polypeptide subunit release factors